MPEEYEVIHEGGETVLRINYEFIPKIPSLEDDPMCMASTIDKLIEVPGTTKIVFFQKRDYEYDFDQVMILREVAELFSKLSKQKDIFSYEGLKFGTFVKGIDARYAEIQKIFQFLKRDPIGTYVELKRLFRTEKIKLDRFVEETDISGQQKYLGLIKYLVQLLEKTRIINLAMPYLAGFEIGDRSVYRRIFRPIIKPDFMFTKLMASYPLEGEEIASYGVGETEITIFRLPETVHLLYHMIPPEFKLSEDHYDILDTARRIM
ncbi:hypothetical protein KY308_03270, partial [Candidatus Woesearchaeota archaeon]|nr:hypothetical protein [Candidatus Woesearchaeota archaeon]